MVLCPLGRSDPLRLILFAHRPRLCSVGAGSLPTRQQRGPNVLRWLVLTSRYSVCSQLGTGGNVLKDSTGRSNPRKRVSAWRSWRGISIGKKPGIGQLFTQCPETERSSAESSAARAQARRFMQEPLFAGVLTEGCHHWRKPSLAPPRHCSRDENRGQAAATGWLWRHVFIGSHAEGFDALMGLQDSPSASGTRSQGSGRRQGGRTPPTGLFLKVMCRSTAVIPGQEATRERGYFAPLSTISLLGLTTHKLTNSRTSLIEQGRGPWLT